MRLTSHQRRLLALITQHGPVTVQSRNHPEAPIHMLDGTIWANALALEALRFKGLVTEENGRWSPHA